MGIVSFGNHGNLKGLPGLMRRFKARAVELQASSDSASRNKLASQAANLAKHGHQRRPK
jgi:hypothetical protein